MATPAQAAAATAGAGSLAAAGAYGITQAVKGSEESNEEEQTTDNPTPITFQPSDLSNYNNQLINIVSEKHLIKLVKSTDENNAWWDLAFKNKFLNKGELTLEETFNNVNNSTTLKTACEEAYKKSKEQYNKTNLLENIGAFCTSEKLPTLEPKVAVYKANEGTDGYTNGLLSVAENKDKLIKKEGEDNKFWWDWAFKNIFKEAKAPFNTVQKGFSDNSSQDATTALNQVCDSGYKKVYTDLKKGASNPDLLTGIKKFCSINGEETVLILPEPSSHTALTNDTGYTGDKTVVKKNSTKLMKPDEAGNQDWWEWVYETRYPKENKTSLPEPFKKIDKGYETIQTTDQLNDPITALNKACKKTYTYVIGNFEEPKTKENALLKTIQQLCTRNTNETALELPDNK